MMYTNLDEIKFRHKGNISTLWKIYQADKKFYRNFYFVSSFCITAIFVLVSMFTKVTSYNIILRIVSISIDILPSLLGFNLGGYILIVGFGATDILSVITKPLEGQNNYSFYQRLYSVMGISVIVQIGTLVGVFLFSMWDNLQGQFIWQPAFLKCPLFPSMINTICLFIIMFLVTYSFILLFNVVKHVFMFGQTIHFCIYTKKLNENKENSNN